MSLNQQQSFTIHIHDTRITRYIDSLIGSEDLCLYIMYYTMCISSSLNISTVCVIKIYLLHVKSSKVNCFILVVSYIALKVFCLCTLLYSHISVLLCYKKLSKNHRKLPYRS